MYAGLIYNDFFSKSLNIFGSEWFVPYKTMSIIREKEIMLDPKNAFTNEAYPIGVDPVWQVYFCSMLSTFSYFTNSHWFPFV